LRITHGYWKITLGYRETREKKRHNDNEDKTI